MRTLLTAIMIPAVCLSLAADSSGRLNGKVTGKDLKPIPTAVITIKRKDINWSKEIKVNEKGGFMQVGIESKDYTMTIEAPGYQTTNEEIHIPLGDTLTKNITLYTTKEATEEALKSGAANLPPGEAQSATGSAAFNQGLEFYNQQHFAEALPLFEKAVSDLHEAAKAMADGEAKTALTNRLPMVDRVYGTTLFEVGKADPAKKDLILKAEPYLTAAYEKNPKDQRTLTALVELSKAKNDAVATQKYQTALDALVGPRPEMAYNDAVTAFNKSEYKEAKECLTKALAIDPNFANSYYLLGMVEFGLNNPSAAKAAFLKFQTFKNLEPAKASQVKDFLAELKNVK